MVVEQSSGESMTTRVGTRGFLMNIGFIGLGNMGLPVARHLLQAGHKLTVYNRTRARTDQLKQLNPVVADSPAAADRKSTRLNSSHSQISYAVFCLKKKKKQQQKKRRK